MGGGNTSNSGNQDYYNNNGYSQPRSRYLTEHSNGDISVGCKTYSLDYWLDHMSGLARQFSHEYSTEEMDSFMIQLLEIYKRRFRSRAR